MIDIVNFCTSGAIWADQPNLLVPFLNTRTNYNMETALFLAAQAGAYKIAYNLTNLGANPVMPNSFGASPLHAAAQGFQPGHSTIVEGLIRHVGVWIDIQNSVGNTPLHVAIQQQNLNMVNKLISMGASVHAANNNGLTPLGMAMGPYCNNAQIRAAVINRYTGGYGVYPSQGNQPNY